MANAKEPSGSQDMNPFIDEDAIAKQHPFPIQPPQLISLAKRVLKNGVHNSDMLDEDNFEFTAPFIGPLDADGFRQNLKTLSLEQAFPDLNMRYYHFRVDPYETNRVWFTLRPIGTNDGPFQGKLPKEIKPTGKVVEEPPQTASLTFNEQGKVIGHTMGYVMDRRIGNTDGLGGAFGLLYGIGTPLPFPEGYPWTPSWHLKLFNSGSSLAQAFLLAYDRVTRLVVPSWLRAKHARNTM